MLLSRKVSAAKLFRFSIFVILSIICYFQYLSWSLSECNASDTFPLAPTAPKPLLAKQQQPQSPLLNSQSPFSKPLLTSPRLARSPLAKRPPPTSSIPEKIWYKLGPKGLSDRSRAWITTCLDTNPYHDYEFLTDDLAESYVRNTFGATRPDIVSTYLAMPFPILKADLLRYLLLFAEGGMWSDLDVSCRDVPIRDWIPAAFRDDVALVVGLEFDEGYDYEFERQFASWTFLARPRSPHLAMVIDDVVRDVRLLAAANAVGVEGLTLEMIGDVCDVTGPRRMTRSIVKSLNLVLDDVLDDRNISHLLEPKLFADVLVLPGIAFAASMNTYKVDMTTEPREPLIFHHYAGSWKNPDGGEKRDVRADLV